jgi:hypothetical protein
MGEMFWIGLGVGIIVGLAAAVIYFIMRAGGASSLGVGLRAAKRAAADSEFAGKLDQLFNPPPPPKPSAEPVRLLTILQREARLLDFLMENIAPYSDDQIGASVRDIHRKSQEAIRKHLTLEPILPQEEGTSVTVPAGFDPSAVRLVGNVTGNPPFTGTLTHAGWRLKTMTIPKPAEGQDEFVLMPAEVEVL